MTADETDRETLMYRIAREPGSPTAYVVLADTMNAADHENLPDGRRLNSKELCLAAIAVDASYVPAYERLADILLSDANAVVVTLEGEVWNAETVARKGLSIDRHNAKLLNVLVKHES